MRSWYSAAHCCVGSRLKEISMLNYNYKKNLCALALVVVCWASPAVAQPRITDPHGFTDRFENIDRTRWRVSHGWANGDYQSCEWRESALSLTKNGLAMTISDKGGKQRPIACAAIQSDAVFGYGRYETRMKAAKGSGIVSAFFSYIGPPHGVPEWDEIDFEIMGKDTTKVEVNYVVNGKGIIGKIVDLGFDASEDFHDYAFEWTKQGITWYVDGKEVYRTPAGAPVPRNPMRIIYSIWTGTSPQQDDWQGKFTYTQPVGMETAYTRFTPYE